MLIKLIKSIFKFQYVRDKKIFRGDNNEQRNI